MSTSSDDDDELEEVEEEEEFEVLEPFVEIDPTTITARSPKKYIEVAAGGGFEVKAGRSTTLQKRAPLKTGKRAGEPQPDLVVEHIWIAAKADGAWFRLHFKDNGFADATVWDVAGWPTELYVEYKPITVRPGRDKAGRKAETEESFQRRRLASQRMADEMNDAYNDGEFWTNTLPRALKRGIPFEEWLADMVPGFVPRKPPVRKPKVKPEEQEAAMAADLLAGGEWQG